MEGTTRQRRLAEGGLEGAPKDNRSKRCGEEIFLSLVFFYQNQNLSKKLQLYSS